MDFGTDAALAVRYRAQHECAHDIVQCGNVGFLDRIKSMRDSRNILKMSVPELVDKGYTPSTLVAFGFNWRNLQRQYGATSLLEMGFTWDQMRDCGIDADSACALGMGRLNITADQLMELKPTIASIASMRLPLETLQKKGFTMDKLISLGLSCSNMNLFGFTLRQWSNLFDCDWSALGFTSYKSAEEAGWPRLDMHELNVFGREEVAERKVHRQKKVVASGNWDF